MTDSMVERVARAIHNAMDIADGLDGTVAEKYARAAIAEIEQTGTPCGVCGCLVYQLATKRAG
jgi:hypothetical protein